MELIAVATSIRQVARIFARAFAPCLSIACLALAMPGWQAWAGNDTPAARLADKLVIGKTEGDVLLQAPLGEGQCFALRFVHSVAKTPVHEWFCNNNGTLYLERTTYQDFGAGLPHEPAPGQTMNIGNGQIEIGKIHRPMPYFEVRVGRMAAHTLILPKADGGTEEKALDSLAPAGSALSIVLEKNKNRTKN